MGLKATGRMVSKCLTKTLWPSVSLTLIGSAFGGFDVDEAEAAGVGCRKVDVGLVVGDVEALDGGRGTLLKGYG